MAKRLVTLYRYLALVQILKGGSNTAAAAAAAAVSSAPSGSAASAASASSSAAAAAGVREAPISQDQLREYLRQIRFFQRKANIRPGVEVAVRVRPMNQREQQEQQEGKGQAPCVFMHGGRVLLSSEDGRRVEPFDFDYALDSCCDPSLKQFASQVVLMSTYI